MSEQKSDNFEDINPFTLAPGETEVLQSSSIIEGELIKELLNKIIKLEQDVQNLAIQNNKKFSFIRILEPNEYRISFLTWLIVNPFSLIFIPLLLGIFIQYLIVLPTEEAFTLTNPTNWTIPLIVSTLGFLVSLLSSDCISASSFMVCASIEFLFVLEIIVR
jgi:hypothetical protein